MRVVWNYDLACCQNKYKLGLNQQINSEL
ncbi:MAG: hypothetical protein F6K25_17580 [Okeania sp. SIO2G4]|nr:hypothetical protein [Okeania sp. SIO2G5]NEP94641.1 hypothetical protein [Okeania sp. SIO2F5]NEQ92399.1 hypothetical protein [Okeania sp. SIO2G4]